MPRDFLAELEQRRAEAERAAASPASAPAPAPDQGDQGDQDNLSFRNDESTEPDKAASLQRMLADKQTKKRRTWR